MKQKSILRASFAVALIIASISTAQQAPPIPKVPDGFEVTIFAQPPNVNYPVCLTAAPTGEVFVGIDKQGSLGKKPGQGSIVRCIDSDGDGKADRINTFAKVDHPRGLIYDNGTMWVLHPPYLAVYFDDDRDGVADRSEKLIEGITTDYLNKRGADHTTNGIRMGIDGWIYIAVGDFGFVNAKGKDGTTLTLKGGGVVRVRPDGTEMEIFARGLRNILDVCIDPELNMFTRDNTNDGGGWDVRLSHIVQSAHYGYPSLFKNFTEEIMPPLAEYGGGSGCGGMFISEPWLPKPYHHALLTCDWGRNEVFYHPLKRVGPTFAAKQESFVSIPRPTDIDVDGSGRIYISSWHNGKFNYAGENIGYVIQLKPKNNQAPAFPDLTELSDEKLVEQLRSPSHVRRFYTQREILRRGERPLFKDALTKLMWSNEANSVRVAALFTFKQLYGAKANRELVKLTANVCMREFALKALADRKSQLDDVPLEVFLNALRDDIPRVQLAALIGLARLGKAEAASAILPLTAMKDAMPANSSSKPVHAKPDPDRVIPHVAVKTLVALNAVEACLEALKGPHRDGALRALQYIHHSKVVDGLIENVNQAKSAQRQRALLTALIRLYHREGEYTGSWWGTRPDTSGPYYHRVAWEATPRIESTLRKCLINGDSATVEKLLAELDRHQVTLKNLPANLIAKAKKKETENNVTVTIPQFDAKNPKQIGNISFERILQQLAAIKGDPDTGAQLFKKQTCHACHTVEVGQTPVGPPLMDISKRYKREQIAESILQPNAQLAQGFATTIFQMTDGKFHTGFIVREAAEEVEIRTNQGKRMLLVKSDIDARFDSKQSVMPDGLVNNLTVPELASLIAYLETLKSN